MSKQDLLQAVERASTDAGFRAQLQANPESALIGYDLAPEERAALVSGDPNRLRMLGVDARISKLDNPALPGEGGIQSNNE
jgi:hypothetical protein